MEIKKGSIVLTSNEYGAVFVYIAVRDSKPMDMLQSFAQMVANSYTINRKRGLGRSGGKYIAAPKFTERKIKKLGRSHVMSHLAQIDVSAPTDSRCFWFSRYGVEEV